jgi:hypothetical protein
VLASHDELEQARRDLRILWMSDEEEAAWTDLQPEHEYARGVTLPYLVIVAPDCGSPGCAAKGTVECDVWRCSEHAHSPYALPSPPV